MPITSIEFGERKETNVCTHFPIRFIYYLYLSLRRNSLIT